MGKHDGGATDKTPKPGYQPKHGPIPRTPPPKKTGKKEK